VYEQLNLQKFTEVVGQPAVKAAQVSMEQLIENLYNSLSLEDLTAMVKFFHSVAVAANVQKLGKASVDAANDWKTKSDAAVKNAVYNAKVLRLCSKFNKKDRVKLIFNTSVKNFDQITKKGAEVKVKPGEGAVIAGSGKGQEGYIVNDFKVDGDSCVITVLEKHKFAVGKKSMSITADQRQFELYVSGGQRAES
jgi:hypothetical protein